ncbi:hypothetical protein EUX98_g9099 [Antrodiella citrinella]|uniref:Cytochrome P450 n=1 Tax=Antrodiella citrinella TaxID=2447956 RepID=A0A4S4LY50_9APHY|nr:hypothetical protein EUX98_g9099 [Antrodiella citrinella]
MDPILILYSVLVALGIYLLYSRATKLSLNDIPGPEPESFWLGSLGRLTRGLVGVVDAAWQEKFGGVAHIKGPLGQDLLWVCDPRALQFIQNGAYNFPKPSERIALATLTTDNGLVTAEGDIHKRQRRTMMPAFGMPESKALFPIFSRCADSITTRWKDQLFDVAGQSTIFNINKWVSCATLDAIGEAAFDHKFGAIDDQEGEFIRSYQSLMIKTFGSQKDGRIIFQSLARFVPSKVLVYFYDHLPSFGFLRWNRAVAHKFAREMIANKDLALAKGTSSHDVMSILVRANNTEDEKKKLSELEMVSQMRTILLAGHETTSTALSWGLLELAKYPEYQTKLRKEIHDREAIIKGRGFNVNDLDNMPFTQACVKEILRLNPPVYHIHRVAGQDVAIPVARPIITKSGKEIREVPVPKGTRIILSIVAYNRDKAIWGEDAHKFNPDRWTNLPEKRDATIGVFGGLATFAGGTRSCIGWRFAVYEIQAFLIELVANFEFAPTEASKKIRKEPCAIMAPTIEGEMERGAQMPLKVTLVQREV